MGLLHDLYTDGGQSPWLDNLRRGYLQSGELDRYVERGIRGITSNPSIFQKAIADSDDYDDEFTSLLGAGSSVEEAYWTMVTADISEAVRVLRPVHDGSDGVDGFVSVEVDPGLARDTLGTIEAARHLHETIDEPNVFVKIPATAEGIPAIQQMIAEGRSINVTLIFSIERYAEVMEAYLSGLEAHLASGATDLAPVRSVASFFISRVDTEVDNRLGAIGTEEAEALRGKAAVAQGQLAYAHFQQAFSGERWAALAAKGAKVQRPLWASTSTKNPDYPDTLYVDSLIGPDTVNTMPEATLEAFADHGRITRTVDADLDGARAILAALDAVGIDMEDVARALESEGVAAFEKSFDDLLETLRAKADDRGVSAESLPGELRVVDDVAAAFVDAVQGAWQKHAASAQAHDVFSIALSGGETARRCYERLADTDDTIDWMATEVYWGDERCVPLDHPDSNYRLGREALLEHVGGVHALYPMRCEPGADDEYHLRVSSLGRLNVVHLGLGTDGHTASLFPGSPALDADEGRFVVPNVDPTGNNQHHRMTLTFSGIALGRLVVVTVSGETKREALDRVRSGADIPAAHIEGGRVLWLVDRAAAGA